MLLSDNSEYSLEENRTVVGIVGADGWSGAQRRFSIVGGADAALFAIDADTGEIRFVGAPNYEAPGSTDGDNLYDVVVSATDGETIESQTLAISVVDFDEAPTFDNWVVADATAIFRRENSLVVANFAAHDPEGAPIHYVLGGADAALFTIDQATGTLSFVTAPDYEAPTSSGGQNSYFVQITATDGINTTGTIKLGIGVYNVNEPVVITAFGGGDTATVSVNENSTSVGVVTATDPEHAALTYTITGGADAALFVIDRGSGALSFAQAPNYEAPGDADHDGAYQVQVAVSDGTFSDSQAITVAVANLAEPVVITSSGAGDSASIQVIENRTAVTTVAATSASGAAITYAIAGGADAALFAIDERTGALIFRDAPDYEAPRDADNNGTYDVVVAANDGVESDTQQIAVKVTNQISAISISSASSVDVRENGTAVTQVSAAYTYGKTSFAITGGPDAARFVIDPVTGALSFRAAPDYEAPTDINRDNIYNIVVTATDQEGSSSRAMAVNVTDVSSAIAITSNGGGDTAAVAIAENGTAVTTVTVSGALPDTPTKFMIVGGDDAARFVIDQATGVLKFATAPDYEAPTDRDHNNVYTVVVAAEDGEWGDVQTINVRVDDVVEGITGTSGADTISDTAANPQLRSTAGNDVIDGRDGNDTIYGVAGNDLIMGGNGNDVLIGGAGSDRMTGGAGADTFAYLALADSSSNSPDRIEDFRRADGDRIHLTNIDANVTVSGDQNFSFIGTNAFTGVAGQLRFQMSGADTLVMADVNGDRVADFAFYLTGNVSLAASDFAL